MIQRIQTLLLLLATLFTGLMLVFPLGYFLADEQQLSLTAWGLRIVDDPAAEVVVGTVPMGMLIVLTTLMTLITVFLYKMRLLQIRLCFAAMVLQLGVQLFVGYYLYHGWRTMQIFEHHSIKFAAADIFPLAALILTFLAFRAIAKDEALVRSLDRIR